ncbi:hypothetical protein EFB14_32805, partial [Rhizobium fabae]
MTEAEKQTGVRVTNWRMVQHRRMEKPVLRTEKIYPVGRMPVKTQPNPGKALQNKRSAPCVLSLE